MSREYSAVVTPVEVEVISMAFVQLAASAAPGLALERPEFQGDLLHEGARVGHGCLLELGPVHLRARYDHLVGRFNFWSDCPETGFECRESVRRCP